MDSPRLSNRSERAYAASVLFVDLFANAASATSRA